MQNPTVAAPRADLAPRAGHPSRPMLVALLAGGLLAALLALAIVVAGGMGVVLQGRVMPFVTVAGVQIGGLTPAEAEARLRAELTDLADGELAVTLDGATTAVTFASLGRDHDLPGLVAAAMAIGRSGNAWADGQARLGTLLLGTELPDAVRVDPARFDRLVVDVATRAFARPQDAAVVTNPDGTYAVVPPHEGRRLHPDQIRAALEAVLLVPRTGDVGVTLTSEVVPFEVTQPEAAEAAAAARTMAAAPLAIVDGEDRYVLDTETIRSAIRFGREGDEPYGVILNPATLGGVVADMADAIHRAPADASFTFDAAGPTAVVRAAPGRELNLDATVDTIIAGLHRRGAGGDVDSVNLIAVYLDPVFTTAEAEAALPNLVRLSTWTTWYVPGDGNGYGANISIPAEALDGMLMLPGATFDFWRDIGPVTPERGYTYGGAIIGGRSTGGVALAGGICSTSTTLFNTALRAGLQMGARLNHYYYIDRYPMGLDATVYATESWAQTMSFTNDTDGPLIIRAFTGWGMVRFDLWGLPTNRVVTFTTPIVSNRSYASDTIEYTSTMPTGTSQRVEYPHHGFWVSVTRIVRDGTSGEVLHEDIYNSSYQTVNGVTLVGTG